ncbi:MAG: dinitrogenase iron-molybdenum cofactor biosynthesis protein [Desulfobulbaceae bacterium A2]|nr:MAG: dinitrogenase iron-molybdenum cofactor biosynthesis protein [Desulfobulbaceae bacterium A2]
MDKKKLRVAVPSEQPGGLDAERSGHFGHCAVFTLVDVNPDGVVAVATLTNEGHEAGGCMMPVRLLADNRVQSLVVGGIGARPLRGFDEEGIAVYWADQEQFGSVRQAVDGIIAGRLPRIESDQVCKGGGDCHH